MRRKFLRRCGEAGWVLMKEMDYSANNGGHILSHKKKRETVQPRDAAGAKGNKTGPKRGTHLAQKAAHN